MPIYVFDCPPEQCRAGCVDRVVVETQFLAQARDKQGQVVIDRRTNQPALVPDKRATWNWLAQNLSYPLPPGANFKCMILSMEMHQERKPWVVNRSVAPVATDQRHVGGGAPVGEPFATRQTITQPPQAGRKGQKREGAPEYEPIDQSGLPAVGDQMFGDSSGDAGTFSDVGIDDQEQVRELRRPPGPRPPEPPKQ